MITSNLGRFGNFGQDDASTPALPRGGAGQDARLPFRRPREAGFYTPRAPTTGFQTHLYPFPNVMDPMRSFAARGPRVSAEMQPGSVRAPVGTRPQLGQSPGVIPGPRPNAPGRRGGLDPYAIIRSGNFPAVRSTAQGIRRGVSGAGAFIRAQTPQDFTAANVPAGNYRF